MDNEIEKIEEINLNGIVIEIQELLKSIPKSNDDKSYFSFKDVVDEQDIEEIRNSNSSEIKIRFNYNNYDNIFWAIEKINSLNINVKFLIEVREKNMFNEFIFNNIDRNFHYDNVKIIIYNEARENIDLINYIINEEKLINMVKPAINLSNIEKFIYAYNIVKRFKPYNQSNNNWEDSRALYDILNNEYMVCAGYVRLLKDLLEKLGIQSQHYGVKVLGEDGLYYNHALLQVRLEDAKYNVDGIYLSDPTNDSDFEYDYYTFGLMTSHENIYSTPDYGEIHFENFYQINSLEEFFEHCTNWIKNNNKRSYYNLIKLLLDSIKCIDIKKYDYLMENYSKIIKSNNLNEEVINRILSDIGCYILDRCNNPIDDNVINSAIKVIYQKFYNFNSDIELSNQLNKTILENKKRKIEFQGEEKSL